MKIKKIEVRNFKAIKEQTADFNGCSAIITAGNNKGKTSILRGLIDRFRGHKPDLIVKDGESKGFNIIELTDGSKIEWKFTEKSESFAYITKEGIKMTQGVLSTIGEKYFGTKFDIDKFLNSGAKVQTKELQKIVGLDFTEIDKRYKIAYDLRADANRELKRIGAINLSKPEQVEKPDIDSLRKQIEKIKKENELLANEWEEKNNVHQQEIIEFNKKQSSLELEHDAVINAHVKLITFMGTNFENCIDYEKAQQFVDSLEKSCPEKPLSSLITPTYISIDHIEYKIESAQDELRNFDSYERDLKQYNDWIKDGKAARNTQEKCDKKVNDIQGEKNLLIANAKIPEEFKINEDGILYNGFPLTDSQISSSAKYIAALKLGSMVLGDIRTMHFDASYLDKNSLANIQKWANDNDLQLLIERPDFDGGEIKYEIINAQ